METVVMVQVYSKSAVGSDVHLLTAYMVVCIWVHCALVQSSRILLRGDRPCLLLLLTTFLHFRILNEIIVTMHHNRKQIST